MKITEGTEEFRFLLSQVMDGFLGKLERVKKNAQPHDALNNVARLCTERSVNCITFNYDDVLDQALAETELAGSDGWHANRGYGFLLQRLRRHHWNSLGSEHRRANSHASSEAARFDQLASDEGVFGAVRS